MGPRQRHFSVRQFAELGHPQRYFPPTSAGNDGAKAPPQPRLRSQDLPLAPQRRLSSLLLPDRTSRRPTGPRAAGCPRYCARSTSRPLHLSSLLGADENRGGHRATGNHPPDPALHRFHLLGRRAHLAGFLRSTPPGIDGPAWSASCFALVPLPCCCARVPPPRFPCYIPETPRLPALTAPCRPILTRISGLATLSLKSKLLSSCLW